MKLQIDTQNVDKVGEFEESAYSIQASAKAFFMLSNGLYSNKILAVIRELSTNAYDSHVDAGKKDVPFDVHLPSIMEPTFYVRDFGTSMDHEQCQKLYTTYFLSTRTNSNDAVGCLGLGSKAPFAYADSFVVEAYLDGVCRTYNAHRKANGDPSFALVNETSTSEPNGIKVSINVELNDIDRFVREAKKVYAFFNTKPNFVMNGSRITFNPTKTLLSGSGWAFDGDDTGPYGDQNLIIMGQIAYPIDDSQLNLYDKDRGYRKFVENSVGLRLYVKIGDVDITPSRETLSYTPDTKANINTLLASVMAEVKEKIQGEIAAQPTLFQARKTYLRISDKCSSIKNVAESLADTLKWNDQALFDNVIEGYIDLKGRMPTKMVHKSHYRKKITVADGERLSFSRESKYFIDDLARGGLSRVKQYVRDTNDCSRIHLVKKDYTDTLLNLLGDATMADVVLTSSLPKVEYNRSSSGGGGPIVHIQVFNEESGHFELCDMSVKYENAHYFVEAKGDIETAYGNLPLTEVETALQYLHEHHSEEIDSMTFYAVKPSIVKNRQLDTRPNWTPGIEIVRKIYDKVVWENVDNIKKYLTYTELSTKGNSRYVKVLDYVHPGNRARMIVGEYNQYKEAQESSSGKCYMVYEQCRRRQAFGVTVPNFNEKDLQNTEFSSRFDAEMAKYPMLRIVNSLYREEDIKTVAAYIDSMDKVVA